MKMGILYSRSIGALSAKGKYIFTMDGDDMYLSNDVLSSITKIALKSNIDILYSNKYISFINEVKEKKIEYLFFDVKFKLITKNKYYL